MNSATLIGTNASSRDCPPRHTAPALLLSPPSSDTVRPGGGNCYEAASRVLNILLALLAFALVWPILLAAIALVRLTSRGPALYSQTRLARGGRPFRIYKIRTMKHECERKSGPRWSINGDPRILPVGGFLRRTHIDELPQLWNILRGDMSMVGPRPERPEFVPQLERVIPNYRVRMAVLPGLTGLAQVHLPPDSDLDSVHRKLAYDHIYVRRRGLWLDLRVLMATVCHVLMPSSHCMRVLQLPRPATGLSDSANGAKMGS
jgi:lipopolysaccharide/colanic/teichoic acid biosynthesis glycosyltransferase